MALAAASAQRPAYPPAARTAVANARATIVTAARITAERQATTVAGRYFIQRQARDPANGARLVLIDFQ